MFRNTTFILLKNENIAHLETLLTLREKNHTLKSKNTNLS
jgi:hypothetical protein